jgi:hypothetical protein
MALVGFLIERYPLTLLQLDHVDQRRLMHKYIVATGRRLDKAEATVTRPFFDDPQQVIPQRMMWPLLRRKLRHMSAHNVQEIMHFGPTGISRHLRWRCDFPEGAL